MTAIMWGRFFTDRTLCASDIGAWQLRQTRRGVAVFMIAYEACDGSRLLGEQVRLQRHLGEVSHDCWYLGAYSVFEGRGLRATPCALTQLSP